MIRKSATPEAIRQVLDELNGIRDRISRILRVSSHLSSGGAQHPFKVAEVDKLVRFSRRVDLEAAECREWLADRGRHR